MLGAHISSSGGVVNAPLNAQKFGCETYQFFSRSPQGGKAPELTAEIIKKFKENNKQYGFKNFYIHAPYYINLASAQKNIYYNSIRVLREELERGSLLGVKAMMFHIGSAKDFASDKNSKEQAIKQVMGQVITGLKEIVKNYTGTCQPLLEISAGSGFVIGDNFKDIAFILKKVNTKTAKNIFSNYGICFDTAHAFASGYDLRDQKMVKKTFLEFDRLIGLGKLQVLHLNDSQSDFNSRTDRHANIGQGKIGLAGFKTILNHPKLKKIDMILETPGEEDKKKDLLLLKKIRNW